MSGLLEANFGLLYGLKRLLNNGYIKGKKYLLYLQKVVKISKKISMKTTYIWSQAGDLGLLTKILPHHFWADDFRLN